jgi:hypothetical protein
MIVLPEYGKDFLIYVLQITTSYRPLDIKLLFKVKNHILVFVGYHVLLSTFYTMARNQNVAIIIKKFDLLLFLLFALFFDVISRSSLSGRVSFLSCDVVAYPVIGSNIGPSSLYLLLPVL